MMLCAGLLGTINLTQYENICIEHWLYINLKCSSTLRKIYILWIKICISLNLSVHFFFGNCSLRITLIFIAFSMSEQLYGHKFFKSWFCRTWVVPWNSIYVSGIAGRDLCKICAWPWKQPIPLNSSMGSVSVGSDVLWYLREFILIFYKKIQIFKQKLNEHMELSGQLASLISSLSPRKEAFYQEHPVSC